MAYSLKALPESPDADPPFSRKKFKASDAFFPYFSSILEVYPVKLRAVIGHFLFSLLTG